MKTKLLHKLRKNWRIVEYPNGSFGLQQRQSGGWSKIAIKHPEVGAHTLCAPLFAVLRTLHGQMRYDLDKLYPKPEYKRIIKF